MDYRSAQTNFDDRTRDVICAIVESYIHTNEPVGSRTLSKALGLGLSPATIRNLMADLTEQGYLEQPHTSAGRVPTNVGYRYYVERCMERTPPPEQQRRAIERTLRDTSAELIDLLGSTSALLASLTRLTSVVASPRLGQARLRLIDFLKVSDSQVYAVLITRSNMVHHRIIEVGGELSQEFLDSVSRYLSEQFAEHPLEEMRQGLLESLVEEKEHYDQLLAQAARLSKKALELAEERELYVEGLSHLVSDIGDVEAMQRLLALMDERQAMIELLDRTLETPGVNIAVGVEAPALALPGCAMVTASYGNGNTPLGTIGVIGPSRMDYMRVIPIVDYTAQLLSATIAGRAAGPMPLAAIAEG